MNLYVLSGPEIGRSIEVKEGVSVLGRSRENDIRVNDGTVSRKHLKIVIKGDRYFITDLKSQNGTYYDGSYLIPGEEVEIVEGAPIAVGMTVICLGETCKDKMAPYLDTVALMKRNDSAGGAFSDRRKRTHQKRGDLINKISLTLTNNLPLNRMLSEVLGHIFHHLKRIDRGVFVLVDPDDAEKMSVIREASKSEKDGNVAYGEKVVEKVLRTGRPVVYSKSYTEDRDGILDTLKILKIQSVMCLPLTGSAEVLGALYIDSLTRPDGFRKYDLLDLWEIAQRIAVTVESSRFAADITGAIKRLDGGGKRRGEQTPKKK